MPLLRSILLSFISLLSLFTLSGCVYVQTSNHGTQKLDAFISEIAQSAVDDVVQTTTYLTKLLTEFYTHQGYWPHTAEELATFLAQNESQYNLEAYQNIDFIYTDDGSLNIHYEKDYQGNPVAYRISINRDNLEALQSILNENSKASH